MPKMMMKEKDMMMKPMSMSKKMPKMPKGYKGKKKKGKKK